MSNPYLARGAVRAALRALDMRPTRGMGQNFLVDLHALREIVGAATLDPDDIVVEVGPGCLDLGTAAPGWRGRRR
jgi:16S rRNA (adenine1518-N6/adenine1519-N6)-dimethyltransferase